MGPPPVDWGYADNWEGFQWLVSGAAYRGYLLSGGVGTALNRLATWAYTLTDQFSPVGLALGFVGLAVWDRTAPRLRNFSLLWITPVSIYAVLYYTRDSEIYLLPVVWLLSIWMAVGLAIIAAWLERAFRRGEGQCRQAGGAALAAAGRGALAVTGAAQRQ